MLASRFALTADVSWATALLADQVTSYDTRLLKPAHIAPSRQLNAHPLSRDAAVRIVTTLLHDWRMSVRSRMIA